MDITFASEQSPQPPTPPQPTRSSCLKPFFPLKFEALRFFFQQESKLFFSPGPKFLIKFDFLDQTCLQKFGPTTKFVTAPTLPLSLPSPLPRLPHPHPSWHPPTSHFCLSVTSHPSIAEIVLILILEFWLWTTT